jgi:MYXO-CTERM domain-containing protein
MKRLITPALVIGLTLGSAQLTHAASAIILLEDESTTTGSIGTVNNVVGYDITVGSSAIWVTSLGYYDPGHDGVADTNAQVGIYAPTTGINGTLLGSVTADISDPHFKGFEGDYLFITLEAPIMLEANTIYRVAANVGNVSGSSHNETPINGTPTFGSDLTINTSDSYSAIVPGGGLIRPNLSSGAPMIYLGNFEYSTTPVPEPSAALLGLLSLGGLLRRRR